MTWGSNWSAKTLYAKNIAGGANTVTVTFSTPITSFGTLYINEYSGIDKVNPLDVKASRTGTGAAMTSGAVDHHVPQRSPVRRRGVERCGDRGRHRVHDRGP